MTQNTIDTRERQLSIYAHTHTYIAWILIQEMYMTQNTIDTRERQNPKSRI